MTAATAFETPLSPPAGVARLFGAAGAGLAAHQDRYGPLPQVGDLPRLLADAGLLGRGGAGFPAMIRLTR